MLEAVFRQALQTRLGVRAEPQQSQSQSHRIRFSVDQHGRMRGLEEYVFVKRLWKLVKYEREYLYAYDSITEHAIHGLAQPIQAAFEPGQENTPSGPRPFPTRMFPKFARPRWSFVSYGNFVQSGVRITTSLFHKISLQHKILRNHQANL